MLNIDETSNFHNFSFTHKFVSCKKSDRLIIFLPSVRSSDIYPYYPRQSWVSHLQDDYNVLYIADPFQDQATYKEPGGSWFIDQKGNSILSAMSEEIIEAAKHFDISEVLLYGSSMGGYAAVCLAALLPNSRAIAECPQLFLEKHPGSRYVCEKFVIDKPLPEPIDFLRKNIGSAEITIVCSLHDHHWTTHVLPFAHFIAKEKVKDVNFEFVTFSNSLYKDGHVALNKKDAFQLIHSGWR